MNERNRVNQPEKYRTFFVSLSLPAAAEIIRSAIEEDSATGGLLEEYLIDG